MQKSIVEQRKFDMMGVSWDTNIRCRESEFPPTEEKDGRDR